MSFPKKVLHITSSYNGGIYSFIKNKMQSISSDEVIMDVVAFEQAPKEVIDDIHFCKGEVYQLPNPKTEGFIKFFKKFSSILDSASYDMVHCHQMGHRALPFYIIAKRKNIKRFVIHAHSAGFTEVESISNRAIVTLKVDRIINNLINAELVTCGEVATNYVFGKGKSKKVTLLTNSIDENQYLHQLDEEMKNQLKIKNDIPVGKYIIGQVGRLDSNKNQEFTIELAYELSKTTNQFYWVLVGQGKNYTNLKKNIENLNLSDTVKLLGRREDISLLYKLMDKVVFPSHTEGFGIVGVEAQAAGIPCIASDSISEEIDLNINLIKFLSLNKKNEWITAIQNQNAPSSNINLIQQQLEKKKFTNKKSAELYKEFILKEYNL